jgi:hypothetical protein
LKTTKEADLRRIIIRMLQNKILKETFVALKAGNTSAVNIVVYLLPGRFKDKLKREKLYISDGLSRIDFKQDEKEEKVHVKKIEP